MRSDVFPYLTKRAKLAACLLVLAVRATLSMADQSTGSRIGSVKDPQDPEVNKEAVLSLRLTMREDVGKTSNGLSTFFVYPSVWEKDNFISRLNDHLAVPLKGFIEYQTINKKWGGDDLLGFTVQIRRHDSGSNDETIIWESNVLDATTAAGSSLDEEKWQDTGFQLITGDVYTKINGRPANENVVALNSTPPYAVTDRVSPSSTDCGDPSTTGNTPRPNHVIHEVLGNVDYDKWKFVEEGRDRDHPSYYTVYFAKLLVRKPNNDVQWVDLQTAAKTNNGSGANLTFEARSRQMFFTQALDKGATRAITSYMWLKFGLTNANSNNPPGDPMQNSNKLFYSGFYQGWAPEDSWSMVDDAAWFGQAYDTATPRGKVYVCAHGSVPYKETYAPWAQEMVDRGIITVPEPPNPYDQDAWAKIAKDWIDLNGESNWWQLPPAACLKKDYGTIFLDGLAGVGSCDIPWRHPEGFGGFAGPFGAPPGTGGQEAPAAYNLSSHLGGGYMLSRFLTCAGAHPSAQGHVSTIDSYKTALDKTIAGGGIVPGWENNVAGGDSVLGYTPSIYIFWRQSYLQFSILDNNQQVRAEVLANIVPVNGETYNAVDQDRIAGALEQSLKDACLIDALFAPNQRVFNGIKFITPDASPTTLPSIVSAAIMGDVQTAVKAACGKVDHITSLVPCLTFDFTQLNMAAEGSTDDADQDASGGVLVKLKIDTYSP